MLCEAAYAHLAKNAEPSQRILSSQSQKGQPAQPEIVSFEQVKSLWQGKTYKGKAVKQVYVLIKRMLRAAVVVVYDKLHD